MIGSWFDRPQGRTPDRATAGNGNAWKLDMLLSQEVHFLMIDFTKDWTT